MKRIFFTILKTMLFLMILFASLRIFFLIYYWDIVVVDNIRLDDIVKIFWHALPLDFSTTFYLTAIPCVSMFIVSFFNQESVFKYLRWYYFVIIAAYVLMVMGEAGIYGEWRTKLTFKAVAYLEHPSEVVNTATTSQLVTLISMWACFTLLFSWWYVRWIEPTYEKNRHPINRWWFPATLVVVGGLYFMGFRGGVNDIPISTSSAYWSKHYFVNSVTVNTGYNLFENTLNTLKFKTRTDFHYIDYEEAEMRADYLNTPDCDSTVRIFKTERPNIVLVLLESWNADFIEALGGEPGIAPTFDSLARDGYLVTNFYATGNRSQQAMASVFGGFPAVPVTTLTNHPEKYYAIPSLVKKMDSVGYYTSFYFGGRLNYGNILSYLRYNEFDLIVEGDDINEPFIRGNLGIHDTELLPWFAKQLANQPEPFFATAFTLSSHSPYDYPKIFEEITWPKIEKTFVNSGHYTDYSLKLLMDVARQQPWYDNTIFVFMADHSHPSYRNDPSFSFNYHHVPFLIYGEPLVDSLKGKAFDKICDNVDFPATLLAQLGLSHDEFYWSRDIFNKCFRPFAFYEQIDGFGWKTPNGEFVYSNNEGFVVKDIEEQYSDSIVRDGKSYMQHHYDLFSRY